MALTVEGQDVRLQAVYPEVVKTGQQFSIMWSVNAGGGEISVPSFDGFYKLIGPQTSYSSRTEMINGKVTKETTYSYVYYLQAIKEGKYTLAPATFTLKNKTFRSDSVRIEVIPGSTTEQTTNGSTGDPAVEGVEEETPGEDIFLNLLLSRREVYLGEHIAATVKLYTRVDLSGINEIKYPSFRDFLKIDLNTPPLSSLRRENVNGEVYGTGVLQQFLLYPQVTGEIEIEPVQISALIQQRSGQSDPFFGDFFSTYSTVPRAVSSKPLKIKVKPLPGNKPDDFSGVVGTLNIKASLSKDSVTANDAVTLKITLSGSGNLKLAGEPVLNISPDIEVYDPKISDELKYGTGGTSGQRSFEYLLIPRHYGDYTIPSVTYSFFNIASGRYERVTTEEFLLHAKKGDDQSAGITVYGGISKEDVKYLGQDIRFIRTESGKMRRTGNLLISSRSFLFYYALSLLVFLIVLFLRREHIKRNADLSIVRNRKAAKIAGKRLNEASLCLKNKEIDRFYEEILKAIWGYLSDKLNISVSDLSRVTAMKALKENDISEDELNNLASLLDTCEFARYAPESSDTEAADIYEKASGFIRSVENSIG